MKILSKYSTLFFAACIASSAMYAQNAGLSDPINQDRAGGSAPMYYQDAVNSTWRPSLVSEGVIDRVKHENKALDWAAIRENDIAFKQRVWRRIDLRQKQNQAFSYIGDEFTGGGSFIEILIDGLNKGKIRAFSDDKFTTVLTGEDLKAKMGGGETTEAVENPITGEIEYRTRRVEFNPDAITGYEMKEDWIFDRNQGRLVSRILSITPLRIVEDETTGQVRGVEKMFTIYYPESRQFLAQYEVYNPENDVHRITWTDFIDSRRFASYITKTSKDNVLGKDFSKDIEGLMKGEQAFEQIIAREQDMWEQ